MQRREYVKQETIENQLFTLVELSETWQTDVFYTEIAFYALALRTKRNEWVRNIKENW